MWNSKSRSCLCLQWRYSVKYESWIRKWRKSYLKFFSSFNLHRHDIEFASDCIYDSDFIQRFVTAYYKPKPYICLILKSWLHLILAKMIQVALIQNFRLDSTFQTSTILLDLILECYGWFYIVVILSRNK